MAGNDEARQRVGQIQSDHATAACRAAQMSLGCIMAASARLGWHDPAEGRLRLDRLPAARRNHTNPSPQNVSVTRKPTPLPRKRQTFAARLRLIARPASARACYHRDDIVGCGLLTEIHGKIFVDESRRLERRTARKPNEIGAAETIETFAVAQQHIEDAVLGERAAELGETEIQDSWRWCVLPTFA